MRKKGQITVYIILGIILLILSAFIFYVRDISFTEELAGEARIVEIPELTSYIESCVKQESHDPINFIGKNGGTLYALANYNMYDGVRYRYLAREGDTNSDFENVILTKQEMEAELALYISQKIESCVDLSLFEEQGYVIEKENATAEVRIGEFEVVVKVKYPLTLSKLDEVVHTEAVIENVESSLGRLYEVAMYALNAEAMNGYFEQEKWMVGTGAEIIIEKHRDYPDILYSIMTNISGDESYFNFAIAGKETVTNNEQITITNGELGCCKDSRGETCFANSKESDCTSKGMQFYVDNSVCDCYTIDTSGANLCNGRPCKDCNNTWDYVDQDYTGIRRKHGESWCVYDGPTGKGFDYVGSGQFKHYCIDGVERVEECRDFREEACVTDISIINIQSACRPNRWHDCSAQTNEDDCTDQTLRDCTWTSALANEDISSYGMQRLNKKCHPSISPGFLHWQSFKDDVCPVANEWRYCDGLNCPDAWVDSLARYCYSMGDCGNYRNIEDDITQNGYFNTDSVERDFLYLSDNLIEQGRMFVFSGDRYIRDQPSLTGNEWDNVGHEHSDMIGAESSWYNDIPNVEPRDFYVYAAGLCYLWKAPVGSNDCRKCDKDKFKDCSEYRCRSLGQGCVYKEIDGVGMCEQSGVAGRYETTEVEYYLDGVSNINVNYTILSLADDTGRVDNSPPEISLTRIFTPGYDSSFSRYNFIPSGRITPEVNIGQEIRFLIETDEPAVCTLSSPARKIFPNLQLFVPEENRNVVLPSINHTFIFQPEPYDELLEVIRSVTDPNGYGYGIGVVLNLMNVYGHFRHFMITDHNVINSIVDSIERLEYPLFIECVDNAGYDGEFVVILDVDGTVITDVMPPQIINITNTSDGFMLFVDEVSECRYDLYDRTFLDMDYELSCPTSIYAMNNDGYYECYANLNWSLLGVDSASFFVRCRDKPRKKYEYSVGFVRGDDLELYEVNPVLERLFDLSLPNIVKVSDVSVLRGSVKRIEVKTDTTSLRFNTTQELNCQYGQDPDAFFEDMDVFPCVGTGKVTCAKSLETPRNTTYYITCEDSTHYDQVSNQYSEIFFTQRIIS